MICPQCHAEYREGFSRCSDCDVNLVSVPVESDWPLANPSHGDPDEDPFCEFWKGTDARLHAELLEVLAGANIPSRSVQRSDRIFNVPSYTAFRIGVPFSLFEKAELAVKTAFEPEPGDSDGNSWFTPRPLLPPSERWEK